MDMHAVRDFIDASEMTGEAAWRESPLRGLASKAVPSDIMGRHAWLMEVTPNRRGSTGSSMEC